MYKGQARRVNEPEGSTEARQAIYKQGYSVKRIYEILPGDEEEVLFLGRWKGDQRMGIPADLDDTLYTAFISPKQTIIGVGW